MRKLFLAVVFALIGVTSLQSCSQNSAKEEFYSLDWSGTNVDNQFVEGVSVDDFHSTATFINNTIRGKWKNADTELDFNSDGLTTIRPLKTEKKRVKFFSRLLAWKDSGHVFVKFVRPLRYVKVSDKVLKCVEAQEVQFEIDSVRNELRFYSAEDGSTSVFIRAE